MALFKDTVALEACPAKTAESVSYGATFAVLGWILFSNYSGMGYASTENDSLASGKARIENPVQALAAAMPSIETEKLASDAPASASSQSSPEFIAETGSPYSAMEDLAAWHDGLQASQHPGATIETRQFHVASWKNESLQSHLTDSYKVDMHLALPLIDTQVIDTQGLLPVVSDLDWTHTDAPDSANISEITVTGSETDRLIARPGNINRPQLPRPYRAREVQRGLVLPPRIQALRP